MLGVLVAFILFVKTAEYGNHAAYFCRFYGYVVEVLLEIWLWKETKRPGPH
jgi:hypothetical protein